MADGSPKLEPMQPRDPAFSRLYREHAPMVRGALRQLGVPPGSVDDAAQDVFVVLHRRIDDFDRDRSMKSWLWGIARGVASGYRRGERRRLRLQAALPIPEAGDRPERGVARREATAILDDFLGSLDEDKCAVFVLSEIEGRRGPEIAQRLDENLNTVYARLRAARKRFHEAVERHRAPQARPLFAAWLPWGWSAWLGKPGVAAVGLGVLATVAATEPSSEPSRSAVVVQAHEPGEATPVVAAEPARERARAPRPVRVAPDDAIEILDDADDALALAEPRSQPEPVAPRRARSIAAAATAIEAMPDDSETVTSVLVDSPAHAPWLTRIDARPSVRHPELLDVRQDFIDELLRIALQF